MPDLASESLPEQVLAERLSQAVRVAGGNAHVARVSGVPLRTLNNYLSGESSPPALTLSRIADACGVSVDFLLGRGVATSGSHAEFGAMVPHSALEDPLVEISILDVRVSAGAGGFNERLGEIGRILLPRSLFQRYNVDPAKAHAIHANGDSMLPTIKDGALCLVNTARRDFSDDGVWVFVFDSQARVKRVRRNFDGSLTVISDNNRLYPPERIERHELDSLNVVGRLFWTEQEL